MNRTVFSLPDKSEFRTASAAIAKHLDHEQDRAGSCVSAGAAAATVAVMGVLSLGVELTVAHTDTGITLPWAWFAKLPLLESVLESRFAMGCIPAIAILLTLLLRETGPALGWRTRRS